MDECRLHVYTGDGKGKTTAAMGLALRAAGHGMRVLAAQFMKRGESGELEGLRRLGVRVLTAPPVEGFTFRMTPEELARTREEQCAFADALREEIEALQPDLVVLDELAVAAALELVDRPRAEALIDAALRTAETAVTGRNAPDWLLGRAAYVSRIAAEKHPYAGEKLPARKGVEW